MPSEEKPTLLTIPRELRDEIYKLVLTTNTPILPTIVWPTEAEIVTSLTKQPCDDPLGPGHLKFRHMNEYLTYAPAAPLVEDADTPLINGKTQAQRQLALYTPRPPLIRTDLMPAPTLYALSYTNWQLHAETSWLFYKLNVLEFGAHYFTMHAYFAALHASSATRPATLPLKVRFSIRMSDEVDEEPWAEEEDSLIPAMALMMRTGPNSWEREVCFGDVVPRMKLEVQEEDVQMMKMGWELDWLKLALEGCNVALFLEDDKGKKVDRVRFQKVENEGLGDESDEDEDEREDEDEAPRIGLLEYGKDDIDVEVYFKVNIAWENGNVLGDFLPVTWEAEQQERVGRLSRKWDSVPCQENCNCIKRDGSNALVIRSRSG